MYNLDSMNKFFSVFLLVAASFLLQACVLNLSNDYYVGEAKDFLTDNFDDSFVYESLSKTGDLIYVKFKASNLNNATVTVKITEKKNSAISVSHSFTSNYLSCRFAQQETSYYEDFFEEYFPDCEISIDNSNRFIEFHGVWSVLNETTGEWEERTNRTPDFDTYLDIIKETELKNCITIVVTAPGSNAYLTNEDYLKACLVDLQNEGIKLDGYFYIVNAINDDYEQNHVMAARINAYDSSRYNYSLLQ